MKWPPEGGTTNGLTEWLANESLFCCCAARQSYHGGRDKRMKNSIWHKNLRAAFLIFLVVGWFCPDADALVGAVRMGDTELRWGQYAHLKGVTGVEFPRILEGQGDSESLTDRLTDYPCSGASAILLYCQEPGRPFFSADGKSLVDAEIERLKEDLDALYKFDMLPILVLFHPDPECRLESEEAYLNAAQTLLEEAREHCWFLMCVSDRCGDPLWEAGEKKMDSIEISQRIAGSIHEENPDQVVAAGGATDEVNETLVGKGSEIDMLVGRVERLELGEGPLSLKDRPIIEVVPASSLSQSDIEKAVEKVGVVRIADTFPYGFAVHFQDSTVVAERLSERDRFLAVLHKGVDLAQKRISKAVPPAESTESGLRPGEAEEGFVSLFNGKDLSGWVPLTKPGNFIVDDGTIRTERFKGGWLRSWEDYGDFVFRGEYWIEEGGNSGFFIRAPLVGRESRIGFEFQIMGQPQGTPIGEESTGSIYYVRPPDGNFINIDGWNEVEITCVGSEIKVLWNGKLAHHFRYEDIDFAKNRSLRGYIGLQDHYDAVKFRNLRIKRLE